MEHSEFEDLLGAFALDAVDSEEAAAIARHLLECPRCRTEVEAYTEVAAAMSGSGTDAPEGLWDRIAGSLGNEPPAKIPGRITGGDTRTRRARRARRTHAVSLTLAAAAVLVAVALLSLQVVDLNSQVNGLRARGNDTGLVAAARTALAKRHRSIVLTSATGATNATVIVSSHGQAYWLGSNLRPISATRTYQLWALTKGRVVSLGLIGSNPGSYSAFRLQPGTTKLMVTNEPEGGTTRPTTGVLVTAQI